MRALHVVAADRWTGAAATALQLVEALRGAGVECALAFRAGDNLEARLAGVPWAHPVLRKERSPADLHAALAALRGLADGCRVVHCHLPHDHLLARLAFPRAGPLLVRSVRHRKHLRRDPFHWALLRGTAGVALANSAMLPALRRFPGARRRPARVLPPVAEPRFAALAGAVARERARAAARGRLEIPGGAFVAGAVGKLDRGRGHDLVLRALASTPDAWGLIVGHGPAERALRSLAARLGVAGRTVFAGYVDRGLEELYAAMDVHVFPAAGSDHGHRAIAEAAACGVPSLAADLPGVSDLVDDGVSGELYPAEDAAALGVLLLRWGGDAGCRRRAAAAALRRAAQWTPDRLAGAALELYAACGA